MTSYQLDTNALLRYLTQDIPALAKQVHDLIIQAQKNRVRLYVCEPVFIETAVMLRNYYKFPKPQVAELLISLLSAKELIIENSANLSKACAIYRDTSIDLIDSILLIRSQTLKHQLFTFDQKLLQVFLQV